MSPKDLFSLTDTFPILSCTRCSQPSVSVVAHNVKRCTGVVSYKTLIESDSSHSHLCQSTPSEDIFVSRFIWVILVWQDLHRVSSKYIQLNHVVLTKKFTWVKLKWDSSLAHPQYSVYYISTGDWRKAVNPGAIFWGLFLELMDEIAHISHSPVSIWVHAAFWMNNEIPTHLNLQSTLDCELSCSH